MPPPSSGYKKKPTKKPAERKWQADPTYEKSIGISNYCNKNETGKNFHDLI
jgi:hypothetical protein